MPTCDRPAFVRQAVRLFERQDYPDRELVVVGERWPAELTRDPGIRFVEAPRGESIGGKRNRACAAATGRYVAHWDDDDWYGPRRLSTQLEPIIAGRADVTALVTPLFFDLAAWRFFAVTPRLHRALFVEDVHGGTLVYRRSIWQRLARYPDSSLAEDAAFLAAAKRRGARLARVPSDGLFVYVRHGTNAWSFRCGEHGGADGWLRAQEPPFGREDRAFYLRRHRELGGTAMGAKRSIEKAVEAVGATRTRRTDRVHPLVSCIMPTKDRRSLVVRALAYFERQDYARRELVVVDDGDDAIRELLPDDPRIRYVRAPRRLSLGEKRNRACEIAAGSVIVHWDDDDWYPADRITYQVEALNRHGAEVCGPVHVLFYAPARGRAWLYHGRAGRSMWLAGSGLCYRAEAWRRHPFAALAIGEDTSFVQAQDTRDVLTLRDRHLLVALIHGANSHPKSTSSPHWRPQPLSVVEAVMGSDYAAYAAGASITANAGTPARASVRLDLSDSADDAEAGQRGDERLVRVPGP